MADCFVSRKPALPFRAQACSIVLLLISVALATDMSRRRVAEVLGPTMVSAELGISFRPPKAFLAGDPIQTRIGVALPLYHQLAPGQEATLVVRRIPARTQDSAGDVCLRVLADADRSLFSIIPFVRRAVQLTPARIGDLEGAQAIEKKTKTLVRAVVRPGGFAHAISLTLDGADLDERIYRIFESTCRTVKLLD
jgi:hypothetical protein